MRPKEKIETLNRIRGSNLGFKRLEGEEVGRSRQEAKERREGFFFGEEARKKGFVSLPSTDSNRSHPHARLSSFLFLFLPL